MVSRRNNPFYRAFRERSTVGCLWQFVIYIVLGLGLVAGLVLFLGGFHQMFRAAGPPAATPTLTPPAHIVTAIAFLPTKTPSSSPSIPVVTPAPTLPGPLLPHPLYFLSDREGGIAQVFLLRGDGTIAKQITYEPYRVLGYALHPEGAFVAVYNRRHAFLIFEEGRRKVPIETMGGEVVRGMALAPTGAHLAVWAETYLAIYDVRRQEPHRIRMVEGIEWEAGAGAVWNTTGTALAYATVGGVYRLGIDQNVDAVLIEPRLAVSQTMKYRVTGALAGGRWTVEIQGPAPGACRVQLVPRANRAARGTSLECSVVIAPGGRYGLWAPDDLPVIRIIDTETGSDLKTLGEYVGYMPVWVSDDEFLVWTCAFPGESCSALALDLYRGVWPGDKLVRWWNSDPYFVWSGSVDAAPADRGWQTFAVVAEGIYGDRMLVVVMREGERVRVVAEDGDNWAPAWMRAF